MELLLAPQSLPFTAALVLVLLIGIIETLAVLSGLTLSGWLDTLIVDSLHGTTDSWLGWLKGGDLNNLVQAAAQGFSASENPTQAGPANTYQTGTSKKPS